MTARGRRRTPPGSRDGVVASRARVSIGWMWILGLAAGAAVLVALWPRNPSGAGPSGGPGPAPATAQVAPSTDVAPATRAPDNQAPVATAWQIPEVSEDPLPAPAYVPRYPKPGEADYADYQEMLRHPAYRTSVDHSPGFPGLPYDPEWRALAAGRRDVPSHDLGLAPGGTATLDDLAEQWVFGVRNRDEAILAEIRITRAEFLGILWPEFPQSRPYVRIPPDEAWFLHVTKMNEGRSETLGDAGNRPVVMESVQVISVKEYTNFRILDLRITAQDESTGESLELTGPEGASVVECRGRYKVYLYRN